MCHNQSFFDDMSFTHELPLPLSTFESRSVEHQQDTIVDRAPLDQAVATRPDIELAGSTRLDREATDKGHGLNTARILVLTIGVFSLIVAPGLVVGIVAKEITVGIALSGAIATVVSVFAGFYYYRNK